MRISKFFFILLLFHINLTHNKCYTNLSSHHNNTNYCTPPGSTPIPDFNNDISILTISLESPLLLQHTPIDFSIIKLEFNHRCPIDLYIAIEIDSNVYILIKGPYSSQAINCCSNVIPSNTIYFSNSHTNYQSPTYCPTISFLKPWDTLPTIINTPTLKLLISDRVLDAIGTLKQWCII